MSRFLIYFIASATLIQNAHAQSPGPNRDYLPDVEFETPLDEALFEKTPKAKVVE